MVFSEDIPPELVEELSFLLTEVEDGFPADRVAELVSSHDVEGPLFAYHLARYAVTRGVAVADQSDFFTHLSGDNPHPGLFFWLAYDAVLRGQVGLFTAHWERYSTFDLETLDRPFLDEALIIPEDPAFTLVEVIVHPRQQQLLRWVQQNLLPEPADEHQSEETTEDKQLTAEERLDNQLVEFLGPLGVLLATFRAQQISLVRRPNAEDLQNLEVLLSDEALAEVDPYWEMRFLLLLVEWRAELALLYEAGEGLSDAKGLNSVLTNPLADVRIFQLEARLFFHQGQPTESREMLRSAEFMAKAHQALPDLAQVLELQGSLFPETQPEVTQALLDLTQSPDHNWLRGRSLALLGNFFVRGNEWGQAENVLEQSLELLQNTQDEHMFCHALADLTYTALAQLQLRRAQELAQGLVVQSRPLLFQLRGRYLAALASLLQQDPHSSVDHLETAVREALTSSDDLLLPWFYELLGLTYMALDDWGTVAKYFGVAAKTYLDSSRFEEGVRNQLAQAYALALANNHGSALSILHNLLANELGDPELVQEVLWAIQNVALLSQEQVTTDIWEERWEELVSTDPLVDRLYKVKWGRSSPTQTGAVLGSVVEDLSSPPTVQERELLAWTLSTFLLHPREPSALEEAHRLFDLHLSEVQSLRFLAPQRGLGELFRRVVGDDPSDPREKLKRGQLRELLQSKATVLATVRVILPNLPFPEVFGR